MNLRQTSGPAKVYPSTTRPGKWLATWDDGTPLRGEDPQTGMEAMSYFDSRDEAVAAVHAGDEGTNLR